jgi:hypothetical protein
MWLLLNRIQVKPQTVIIKQQSQNLAAAAAASKAARHRPRSAN